MTIFSTAPARRRRLSSVVVSMLAALFAVAGLSAALWPASASSATPVIQVLGKTEFPPKPACPATDTANCMAVGNVTVFQSLAGEAIKPFEVPFRGKLVSWSITLAKPTRSEIRGFDDFYGKPAQARIAVLRRVGKSRPPVFKMVRQSPVQPLNSYFGRTVHFALEKPLIVLPGHIVALTIPTWAPNWAINLPEDNTWRASRNAQKCDDTDIQESSRPQQKVGSNRQYGCYFTNTRFLYTATVVKQPEGRSRARARARQASASRARLRAVKQRAAARARARADRLRG